MIGCLRMGHSLPVVDGMELPGVIMPPVMIKGQIHLHHFLFLALTS